MYAGYKSLLPRTFPGNGCASFSALHFKCPLTFTPLSARGWWKLVFTEVFGLERVIRTDFQKQTTSGFRDWNTHMQPPCLLSCDPLDQAGICP